MLSPIVPVLMASAMLAGTVYYTEGTESTDLPDVMAKNFSTYHAEHLKDAEAQIAAKIAEAAAANQGTAGSAGTTVVVAPAATTTSTTGKTGNWGANSNAGGNANGAGNSENSNAGGLGYGRGKTKTTTTATPEVLVVVPPVEAVPAQPVQSPYDYFKTVRDVAANDVPGYSNMGGWSSRVWAINETTVAMVTFPTPDASGHLPYGDEIYENLLREAELDMSTDDADIHVGRLVVNETGGFWIGDQFIPEANGLNLTAGTPAIITYWNQTL